MSATLFPKRLGKVRHWKEKRLQHTKRERYDRGASRAGQILAKKIILRSVQIVKLLCLKSLLKLQFWIALGRVSKK